MQVNVPCIALIEDIDNVFHGRENVVRTARHDVVHARRREKKDDERQGKDDGGARLVRRR